MEKQEILTIISLVVLALALLSGLGGMASKNAKTKEKLNQICSLLVFLAVVLIGVSQLLTEPATVRPEGFSQSSKAPANTLENLLKNCSSKVENMKCFKYLSSSNVNACGDNECQKDMPWLNGTVDKTNKPYWYITQCGGEDKFRSKWKKICSEITNAQQCDGKYSPEACTWFAASKDSPGHCRAVPLMNECALLEHGEFQVEGTKRYIGSKRSTHCQLDPGEGTIVRCTAEPAPTIPYSFSPDPTCVNAFCNPYPRIPSIWPLCCPGTTCVKDPKTGPLTGRCQTDCVSKFLTTCD